MEDLFVELKMPFTLWIFNVHTHLKTNSNFKLIPLCLNILIVNYNITYTTLYYTW